jgi:hypothetical protein
MQSELLGIIYSPVRFRNWRWASVEELEGIDTQVALIVIYVARWNNLICRGTRRFTKPGCSLLSQLYEDKEDDLDKTPNYASDLECVSEFEINFWFHSNNYDMLQFLPDNIRAVVYAQRALREV